MEYNLKFIEFLDGTTQVRAYDGVIVHKKKSKKLPAEPTAEPQEPIVIETTIEELIEKAKQTELELERKKEYSLRSSVSRTRNKIEQLARSGNFSHFVTLTYDPKKIDRYDYDACIRTFYVWLQNVKRKAPTIQALFVPEFHTKNSINNIYAIHFHGLIGNIDGLKLQTKCRRKDVEVYSLIDWNFGFSDVTKIENSVAICRYIRKYVTKQSISIARTHKGRHRYFTTGLKLPREKKILIDGKYKEKLQQEYIERYAERNNLEISSAMEEYSEYGYIPVKYFELKPKS